MAVTNHRQGRGVRGHLRGAQGVALKSSDPVVRTARLVQNGAGNFEIVYSEPRGKGEGWRSRTLSTRTADPVEAQQELDRFIDKAIEKSQPRTSQDQLTVEDACRDYLADRPRQRINLTPIRAHLGSLRVQDLTLDLVRNYRDAHPFAANTFRRRLGALKAALNHARKAGRLAVVPYIELPAAGASRVRWLTREQLAMVRDKVRENAVSNPGPASHALKVFVFLASTFGARREAIRDLTWDRVDFTNRTVNFKDPNRVENKKRRAVIHMSNEAFAFLRAVHLQAGRPATGQVIAVSNETLKYAYRKFFDGIGLDWCTSHVFRHTVATHMLQDHESIYDVALFLADTVRTIETTYAHVPPAGLKQVAENRKLGW